jgi:DNA-directed RNA polymerase specialized sigma24 family protein
MNDLTSVTGNELRALGNQGFTLALRILRHREDAADAVQDAMHQLVRKHASYDARRGWRADSVSVTSCRRRL